MVWKLYDTMTMEILDDYISEYFIWGAMMFAVMVLLYLSIREFKYVFRDIRKGKEPKESNYYEDNYRKK